MIILDSLVLLAVMVYGLIIALGMIKWSGFLKAIGIILVAPIILMAMINQLSLTIATIPVAPKVVVLLLAPLVVKLLLGYFFPKSAWSKRTQEVISSVYKFKWGYSVLRWLIAKFR